MTKEQKQPKREEPMDFRRFAVVLGAINLAIQEKATIPKSRKKDTVRLALQYGRGNDVTPWEINEVLRSPIDRFLPMEPQDEV